MTTAVKERPILFSAPMVRAILDGRKTQTRRVVKPQPASTKRGRPWCNIDDLLKECPYGAPGDRLWVKHKHLHTPASDLCPERVWDDATCIVRSRDYTGDWEDRQATETQTLDAPINWKRRPSIHMPRWASRITLEVVSVRVERLQEIGEADARAEGVECEVYDGPTPISGYWWDYHLKCWSGAFDDGARGSFRTLWDSINGKSHPWASNPWVWVVEFRRIKP